MADVKAKSDLGKAPIYWMHEAIIYIGLDRLGLAHPEQTIYRMVRKGILKPRRIGRFLAFSKSDLEYVITNGKKRRKPGRPRKNEKIKSYENPV
jgi:predicted DNA-binding transcriptional regulator AlpA